MGAASLPRRSCASCSGGSTGYLGKVLFEKRWLQNLQQAISPGKLPRKRAGRAGRSGGGRPQLSYGLTTSCDDDRLAGFHPAEEFRETLLRFVYTDGFAHIRNMTKSDD